LIFLYMAGAEVHRTSAPVAFEENKTAAL